MARRTTLFRLSLTVVFVFIVVACDRSPSRSPKRVELKRPITFAEARFMRVVPVVDGGAYAAALMDGGVWYVNGAEAVRVSGLPADVFPIDVVPLAEGGALAFASLSDKGPWFLEHETATPILEVTQRTQKRAAIGATGAAKGLWVLLQHEAAKARAAEEASADLHDAADGASDE
jgi:hypothetical protein